MNDSDPSYVSHLQLPQVTLVAVTSVALAATIRAIGICKKAASFGAIKLLTHRDPDLQVPDYIELQEIPRLSSRQDYSNFILRELHRYIETPFALCVQWDSYIIDSQAWNDAFLNYDFVGAPWPQFSEPYNVGNGGFSLRSKKLLDACASLPMMSDMPEDVTICRQFRADLEKNHGIRFAPTNIAASFAFERTLKQKKQFGFHGVFNMIDFMERKEFLTLLKGLEANVIGDREISDIAIIALKRKNYHLLLKMICNRILRRFGKL